MERREEEMRYAEGLQDCGKMGRQRAKGGGETLRAGFGEQREWRTQRA